jgi:hypothetical protein
MPDPRRLGLAQAVAEEFSWQGSVGGVRGLVESVLPVTVFTALYALTRALTPSLVGALAVAVLLVLARAVVRQPVMPAVSGLLGVGLGAAVAWVSGNAADYFLLPLLKNAFFALVYAGSALAGWPLVGLVLGMLLKEQTAWRQVPQRRQVYTQATWLWAGMFALRFAVELPLYLERHVVTLGVLSVPLGLPLFGVVLLLTWLIVRRVPVVEPPQSIESPAQSALVEPTEPVETVEPTA